MSVNRAPLAEDDDAVLLDLVRRALPSAAFGPIGVAVSGGSDSLAALHLMANAAAQTGWALRAVTVDHALRPEAAIEARGVAALCAGLGIAHDTLRWDHGLIAGNVPDAARRARYGLMADWAQAVGVGQIVLGHTANDQAENFLMGLGRAAGLDGLIGMRPAWDLAGVRFVRPFLTADRAQLRRYLQRLGVVWVEDPTNADDRYTRVKARRALSALAPLGITVDRIAAVMANLSAAQNALDDIAQRAARSIARTAAGEVIFDRALWQAQPPEVQRRLLLAALRWISRADYAPRAAAIARLIDAIHDARPATLWGCRLRGGGAEFCLSREPRAVAVRIAGPDGVWDGRWQVTGPFPKGAEIRALGALGLRSCPDWRQTGHSREALIVTPAVWQGECLIAAPLAGHANGFEARIVAADTLFTVSH